MASDKSRPEGDGEAGSGDERDDAGSLDDLPRFPLRGLQWHERNLEKGLTKAERQLARHNDPAERVTALLGMADAQDRLGRLQAALGRPLVVGDQRDERFHFGALEAARELRGAALETAREAPGDQPVLFAKVYGALTLDHARAGEWDRARSRLMDADTKYSLAIATGVLDSHRDRVDLWRQCGLARWNYAATGLTEWGPGGPPPEAMQAVGHNAKWQDHLNGAFGLLDGSGSPEVRLLADTRDDPIRPPLPLNGLLGPA